MSYWTQETDQVKVCVFVYTSMVLLAWQVSCYINIGLHSKTGLGTAWFWQLKLAARLNDQKEAVASMWQLSLSCLQGYLTPCWPHFSEVNKSLCPLHDFCMIFVEVAKYHPQVLSLLHSCIEGPKERSRMRNTWKGFTFWASVLLKPKQGEGACYTKHLQASQEMKTENTKALARAFWSQWKTHLLIWTENQTY